jgi:hypothetical protein
MTEFSKATKAALIEALQEVLAEADDFCGGVGVDVHGIIAVKDFRRVGRIGKAVETLIGPDERRREYLRRADAVVRAYKALLPDEVGRSVPQARGGLPRRGPCHTLPARASRHLEGVCRDRAAAR